LRAQLAALEKHTGRIADLEKQGVEREKKRNAKRAADLEKQNANLDSKNNNLDLEVLQLELEGYKPVGVRSCLVSLRRARTRLQRV
jgi:hypothetical protein